MKLCAIYNIFADSVELLPYSLNCLVGEVDEIIFVTQDVSNFGEKVEYELFSEGFLEKTFSNTIFTYVRFKPNLKLKGRLGMQNEKAKRQLGLEVAKQGGCTHYCFLDQDELWKNFGLAKKQFFDSGKKSSVAKMWTFFKKPTLRFEFPDNYYVPFITELRKDSVVGSGYYPYYTDPTRKPNESDVYLISEMMSHFSWVRKDINLKIRNSSARDNLYKSKLLRDYFDPNVGPGFYVEDFKQKLIAVDNIFNIEI